MKLQHFCNARFSILTSSNKNKHTEETEMTNEKLAWYCANFTL